MGSIGSGCILAAGQNAYTCLPALNFQVTEGTFGHQAFMCPLGAGYGLRQSTDEPGRRLVLDHHRKSIVRKQAQYFFFFLLVEGLVFSL